MSQGIGETRPTYRGGVRSGYAQILIEEVGAMKSTHTIVSIASAICLTVMTAGQASGDWDPGDGHKMHYPQLPDADGWDVRATFPIFLADSWQCSESGSVDDIHVWGSWKGGQEGVITGLSVLILGNLPADPYDTVLQANQLLWQRSFGPSEFSVRPCGDGTQLQGWYDPKTGETITEDHSGYHQINITDISDPLEQEQGEIYWLGIIVEVADDVNTQWGWKTSESNHFGDDAIWLEAANGGILKRLLGPAGETVDLAFVITPEPGTLGLLLVGGLLVLRGKRSR